MSLGPESGANGGDIDIREARENHSGIPAAAITEALTNVVSSGRQQEVVAALRSNMPEASGDIQNIGTSLGGLLAKLKEIFSGIFKSGETTTATNTTGTATTPVPNASNAARTPNDTTSAAARQPSASAQRANTEALAGIGAIEKLYADSHGEGLSGGLSATVKRGAQSSFGLAKLQADRQANQVPKTIGWSFGANDIMSGNAPSALSNAESAIKIAETAGSKFTLIAVPPMSKGGRQPLVDNLNKQYEALAARYPHVTFVNPYVGMTNRSDGVHLAMSDYAAAGKALGVRA